MNSANPQGARAPQSTQPDRREQNSACDVLTGELIPRATLSAHQIALPLKQGVNGMHVENYEIAAVPAYLGESDVKGRGIALLSVVEPPPVPLTSMDPVRRAMSLLLRCVDWTTQFPKRRIDEWRLAQMREAVLSPEIDVAVQSMIMVMRYADPAAYSLEPERDLKVECARSRRGANARRFLLANRDAENGARSLKGTRFAMPELLGPIGLGEFSIPQYYRQFVNLRVLSMARHGREEIICSPLQIGVGERLEAGEKDLFCISFVASRSSEQRAMRTVTHSKVPKLGTRFQRLTEDYLQHSAQCQKGYTAQNGTVFWWVDLFAPPPLPGELTTAQGNRWFMEALAGSDDLHPHVEFQNYYPGRRWGNYLDRASESTLGSFYYWALMRGQTLEGKPVQRSSDDELAPRVPATTWGVTAYKNNTAPLNAIAEQGLFDKWGYGWACIDDYAPPLLPGELTWHEQCEEFLKRVIRRINRHSHQEILEVFFDWDESPGYLNPHVLSVRRRMWLRLFDPEIAAGIRQAPSLDTVLRAAHSRDETMAAEVEMVNAPLWFGVDDNNGNKFMCVQDTLPPPIGPSWNPLFGTLHTMRSLIAAQTEQHDMGYQLKRTQRNLVWAYNLQGSRTDLPSHREEFYLHFVRDDIS